MHSIAATSLGRVLTCNGSVTLGVENTPSEPSESKREGIAAHYVAAGVLNGTISSAIEHVDRKTLNGYFVTAEMAEFVQSYITAIESRALAVTVEQPIEWIAMYGDEGSLITARPDAVSFDSASGTLYIDNLNYGWRIVEPFQNWALVAYAIASIGNKPVTNIEMTIHQPRPYHEDGKSRTWTITRDELNYLQSVISNKLANLDDKLVTSMHCHKCPALAVCPAARVAEMNAIDASTIAFVDDISDDELNFALINLERASEMIKQRLGAISELVIERIKLGRVIGDHYLKPTIGNRTWNIGLTPTFVKAITGVSVESVAPMVTPAEAQRRGISEDTLKGLTMRPSTGIKLDRKSADKRAQKLFKKEPQ